MNGREKLAACVPSLCDWFAAGQRLLPWRTDPTPYRVWVSEIMLQQTRIEAVLPYFERFTAAFPTVADLANADPDRLMKLWEGLGYYSRARNLQKAARQVMERHGGELPADYEQLRALAGIGEYTAGAIASIAFHLPVPAVDGNVLRVLARMTACEGDVLSASVRRELTALAASLVPPEDPAAFNQGLMELGERVCLPNTMPRCDICPVRAWCAVAGTEKAASLPVRKKPKPRRIEKMTVTVILTNEATPRVLLHKRDNRGLLSGLWELPHVAGYEDDPALPCGLVRQSEWIDLPDSRHVFSHIEWHMKGRLCVVSPSALPAGYVWADRDAVVSDHALPTAFRAYSHMLPVWLDPSDEKG